MTFVIIFSILILIFGIIVSSGWFEYKPKKKYPETGEAKRITPITDTNRPKRLDPKPVKKVYNKLRSMTFSEKFFYDIRPNLQFWYDLHNGKLPTIEKGRPLPSDIKYFKNRKTGHYVSKSSKNELLQESN
jgi:hypothetical protein